MQLKQASLSTAASRMPFQSVSMALFVLSDFQFFLSFLFSPSFPRLPYVLILSPLLASFNPPSLTSSHTQVKDLHSSPGCFLLVTGATDWTIGALHWTVWMPTTAAPPIPFVPLSGPPENEIVSTCV